MFSSIGHFRVAETLIMKARLSAKALQMKISFVCMWMKTNFHIINFALSLAFMMRFTATRKWPDHCASHSMLCRMLRMFPRLRFFVYTLGRNVLKFLRILTKTLWNREFDFVWRGWRENLLVKVNPITGNPGNHVTPAIVLKAVVRQCACPIFPVNCM